MLPFYPLNSPVCQSAESGANGHWVPYGYEYNGQAPLFDASLACDRIAYGILTAVSASGGICVLNQDARKNQLKSMCFIFGRPIFFVAAGIQDNFGEALVGSVITNTWIYVRYVESPAVFLSSHTRKKSHKVLELFFGNIISWKTLAC